MSDTDSTEQIARDVMPDSWGAHANISAGMSSADVRARWGDINGCEMLSVYIGDFSLCVTRDQWAVIAAAVDAVLPAAVAS